MEAPTTNLILPPGTAFAPAFLPGLGWVRFARGKNKPDIPTANDGTW